MNRTKRSPAVASPGPRDPLDKFLDALATRLRKHAKAVRSIGTGFGRNAESLLIEKDEVAAELDKLAAALERVAN